jgi:hypothetical protein
VGEIVKSYSYLSELKRWPWQKWWRWNLWTLETGT